MMKFFAHELPDEYGRCIDPLRRRRVEWLAERLRTAGKEFTPSVIGPAIGQEFSLTALDQETYRAWQQLFRAVYPAKPVMLDVIWSSERLKSSEGGEE